MNTKTWIALGLGGGAVLLYLNQKNRLDNLRTQLAGIQYELANLPDDESLPRAYEDGTNLPGWQGGSYWDGTIDLSQGGGGVSGSDSGVSYGSDGTDGGGVSGAGSGSYGDHTKAQLGAAAKAWASKCAGLGLSPCDFGAGVPEPWASRINACGGNQVCEDKVLRSLYKYWPGDMLCASLLQCGSDRVCAQKAYDRIVGATTTSSPVGTRDHTTLRGRWTGGW